MKYVNKILMGVFFGTVLFLNITSESMLRTTALALSRTFSTPHISLMPGDRRTVKGTPSARTYRTLRGDGTLLAVNGRILPSPVYTAPDGRCVQCNSKSVVVTAPVAAGVHNFIMNDPDKGILPVSANNAATAFGSTNTSDPELLKDARNSCLINACLQAGLFAAGVGTIIASARNQSEIGITIGAGITAYNGLAGLFAARNAYTINKYYQAFN